jgi:hypothetical protein
MLKSLNRREFCANQQVIRFENPLLRLLNTLKELPPKLQEAAALPLSEPAYRLRRSIIVPAPIEE